VTRRRGLAGLALAVVLSLPAASCAPPPLAVYTLEPPPRGHVPPLTGRTIVIEVSRVAVPDYLDTQDIVVRNGNSLQRSPRGRWASRFSLIATHYVTGLLAARRPGALVTDQPQAETPNDRIQISISTLDVASTGVATLDANWTIVPRNTAQPMTRQRGHFTATGPAATDKDVVALVQSVLQKLSAAIDIGKLR